MAAFWVTAGIMAAIGGAAAIGARAIKRRVRNARDDHGQRPALWNRFYALDWGDITTNNYGFAPAEGSDPQRYQHQLYRELLKRLVAKRPLDEGLRLLEVSCGRGGGLNAFLEAANGQFDAVGLDIASSAIEFCRRTYGENERLHFVQGSALNLPFPDGSFDVVLNVEASNDYGDRSRFFGEVARVLKKGGVFLFTDSVRAGQSDELERSMEACGLEAVFDDITANVVEASRLDTPRRLELIRRQAPLIGRLLFRRELANYAAVAGSRKYRAFAEGHRSYLMTAAIKQ